MADGTGKPEEDREAELESGRMPLLDHLIELRNRLMWSFGAIIVAFLICYQVKEVIYRFLAHPLAEIVAGEPGRKMIFTALTEAFFTYVKVSFWAALCLSFPIVATQIWKFVAPGLYKNERRAFLPYLCATPVLFAFGVAFQLPVLLTLMARAGLITSAGLLSKWRYAVVGMFAVAAVLTPPDIVSQISLAVPLIILYFLSIYSCRLVEKARAKREAAGEAELAGGGKPAPGE